VDATSLTPSLLVYECIVPKIPHDPRFLCNFTTP